MIEDVAEEVVEWADDVGIVGFFDEAGNWIDGAIDTATDWFEDIGEDLEDAFEDVD